MRKIFLAALMVIAVCSESFAVSQDMGAYVRQDVFDAKMEMLFMRLEGKIDSLSERIDGVGKSLSERINGVEKSLSARIDGVEKTLSERIDGVDKKIDSVEKRLDARIDGVEKRMGVMDKRMDDGFSGMHKRIDDNNNFVYWVLVLLGAMITVPFINKFWDFAKEARTPAVTLDDVKSLIAEAISEAKLQHKA